MKTLRVPMAGGFILAYIRPTAIVPAEERSRLETRNLRIGCIGIFFSPSLSLGFEDGTMNRTGSLRPFESALERKIKRWRGGGWNRARFSLFLSLSIFLSPYRPAARTFVRHSRFDTLRFGCSLFENFELLKVRDSIRRCLFGRFTATAPSTSASPLFSILEFHLAG